MRALESSKESLITMTDDRRCEGTYQVNGIVPVLSQCPPMAEDCDGEIVESEPS